MSRRLRVNSLKAKTRLIIYFIRIAYLVNLEKVLHMLHKLRHTDSYVLPKLSLLSPKNLL